MIFLGLFFHVGLMIFLGWRFNDFVGFDDFFMLKVSVEDSDFV